MIYLFLANGFEEIESVATIDVLRRADLQVTVVGIGSGALQGSHGIAVAADIVDSDLVDYSDMTAVILPGGMPGTLNLDKSEKVKECIKYADENNKLIAAICAAPSVLGRMGLLKGKRAVCFDGFENLLDCAEIPDIPVCTDGNIITARGAGVAIDFGLEIVKYFKGEKAAKLLHDGMKCL